MAGLASHAVVFRGARISSLREGRNTSSPKAGPDLQIRMGMGGGGGGGNGGEDGSGGGHPDPHIRWRSQKNFFRSFGLLPGSTTEVHSFFFNGFKKSKNLCQVLGLTGSCMEKTYLANFSRTDS